MLTLQGYTLYIFKPEDFERGLRNELLGIPTRRTLKNGSVPKSTKEIVEATVHSHRLSQLNRSHVSALKHEPSRS